MHCWSSFYRKRSKIYVCKIYIINVYSPIDSYRSSSSYLAVHPGGRSPSSQKSQPWPQFSMEICLTSRTLEAPCGNCYAQAWGMRVMMMNCTGMDCSRKLQSSLIFLVITINMFRNFLELYKISSFVTAS